MLWKQGTCIDFILRCLYRSFRLLEQAQRTFCSTVGGKVPWGYETGKFSLKKGLWGFFNASLAQVQCVVTSLPWGFHPCLPALWFQLPGFSLNYFALDASLPVKMTACFATYCTLWPDTANNIDAWSFLLSKLVHVSLIVSANKIALHLLSALKRTSSPGCHFPQLPVCL